MNLPGNTFGKSVRNAAVLTGTFALPFAAEGGNPAAALVPAAIAGGIAAVNHIVRSVSHTNEAVREAQYDAKFEQAKADRQAAKAEQAAANSASRSVSLSKQLNSYKSPK
jgi:outer membrane murein-binding lipoprotein Lpp